MVVFTNIDYSKLKGIDLLKTKRKLLTEINRTEKKKHEEAGLCLMFHT